MVRASSGPGAGGFVSCPAMDIKGAAAIVTGGASGLGEATVRRLDGRGRGRHDPRLQRRQGRGPGQGARREVRQGRRHRREQVAEAVAAAAEDAPLRVGVNCAGTGTAVRTIGKDGTPHIRSEWDRVLGINLLGTFLSMTHEASQIYKSEPLADGQRGVIINTASVAAFDGQIGQLAYAASKGGVVAMTLPAARDLSVAGIRVVTIAPGLMDTPLLGMLPAEAKAALGASRRVPEAPRRPGRVRQDGDGHRRQRLPERRDRSGWTAPSGCSPSSSAAPRPRVPQPRRRSREAGRDDRRRRAGRRRARAGLGGGGASRSSVLAGVVAVRRHRGVVGQPHAVRQRGVRRPLGRDPAVGRRPPRPGRRAGRPDRGRGPRRSSRYRSGLVDLRRRRCRHAGVPGHLPRRRRAGPSRRRQPPRRPGRAGAGRDARAAHQLRRRVEPGPRRQAAGSRHVAADRCRAGAAPGRSLAGRRSGPLGRLGGLDGRRLVAGCRGPRPLARPAAHLAPPRLRDRRRRAGGRARDHAGAASRPRTASTTPTWPRPCRRRRPASWATSAALRALGGRHRCGRGRRGDRRWAAAPGPRPPAPGLLARAAGGGRSTARPDRCSASRLTVAGRVGDRVPRDARCRCCSLALGAVARLRRPRRWPLPACSGRSRSAAGDALASERGSPSPHGARRGARCERRRDRPAGRRPRHGGERAPEPTPGTPSELACNGSSALCDRRLDQVVFAGSHNSMASASDPGWFFAENLIGIPAQLESGVRALLVKTHYGIPTGVAGRRPRARRHRQGVGDRERRAGGGRRAVARGGGQGPGAGGHRPPGQPAGRRLPLPRLLLARCTSSSRTASTSIRHFLDRNPNEVVMLFIGDYVSPQDTQKVLEEAHLLDRVWSYDYSKPPPTLREMIEAKRNLLVLGRAPGRRAALVHEGLRHLPGHAVHVRRPVAVLAAPRTAARPTRRSSSSTTSSPPTSRRRSTRPRSSTPTTC